MLRHSIVSTVIRLLVVSLLIGLVLSLLDITPDNLLSAFGDTVERIFRIVISFGSWAARYVFVGAVVVVPIWLLIVLLRFVRTKKQGRAP